MSDVLPFSTLTAVSPCDGRYADKTASLREYFSEFGLIKRRVVVEIAWLIQLSESGIIAQLPPFDAASRSRLDAIARDFSVANAERVKAIEKTTNHDMKAVEYFVKEACTSTEAGPPSAQLESAMEFVHFACTSEDVNNLSYSLMLREAREQQLMPVLDKVEAKLVEMAHAMAEVPMLAHTHGQPATPTTVGKEFANVVHRLRGQMQAVRAAPLLGTTACAKVPARLSPRPAPRRPGWRLQEARPLAFAPVRSLSSREARCGLGSSPQISSLKDEDSPPFCHAGKIAGATGSYNAHMVACPDADWPAFAEKFVSSLGLTFNAYVTQIEPHDCIAELFHALTRRPPAG